MINERAQESIEDFFRKTVRKDPKIRNAYLLVQSDKHGINLNLAEGSTGSMLANIHQPFYIASVSKLISSVLTGILVEGELLSFEDSISNYLEPELLDNLHIYRGKDYTNNIKVKHLLGHTSGLNDFMEDKTEQGETMMDQLLFDDPSKSWTPQEVIQWSKEKLKSHFPPGEGFHYSDTGYHLLGLLIEKATTKPFHEVLQEYIFEPLGMNHSYFANYSRPLVENEYPLAHLYGNNKNITDYKSLSFMFAGGGIVSTTGDLYKFMKALVNHEIITKETFEKMSDWQKFFPGIDYGYGLMKIKTIPILMPAKYNAWGIAGSTGTFMFYHPVLDTYLIGSLNHLRYSRKGIMFMLKTIDKLIKSTNR